jgi:murein DD-endopeptidase MepM/ murein hydrolase activator NlpD
MSCDCSIIDDSAKKNPGAESQQASQSTQAAQEEKFQNEKVPSSENSPLPQDISLPTEMLPRENIECYARRASTNGKNDVAEKIRNTIDNTSISCDLNNFVEEQFRLTPGSSRTVTVWKISVDGNEDGSRPQLLLLKGLQFSNGKLSGTLNSSLAGKTIKILIAAYDTEGEIDTKEYNLTAKSGKSASIKFLFPYEGNGRVTCSFGPRNPPKPGASSMHKGIDISQPGAELGYILSSADGVVTQCGPARGYGNWIVIEHRDFSQDIVATTVYGHMNDIYVSVGQRVAAGQRIAKEGNAGIGTAAHLHFELHKGKLGNPVDPIPYINGNITIAQNNLKGQFGIPDEKSFTTISNSLRGMSKEEKPLPCPSILNQTSGVSTTIQPNNEANKQIVENVLNNDRSLSDEDRRVLNLMASSQSGYDAQFVRSGSTSKGIFQMTDKVAGIFYSKIGASVTGDTRVDPETSTRAQIRYYKDEMVKYWDEFNRTKLPGPATLAGKPLTPELTAKYSSLTKEEFIYGLIYHDGVKNAIIGRDLQGVEQFRKRSSI